jgi:hypothetical protein
MHDIGVVSLLPNSTKKTTNRIFSMVCSLCQHAACPLEHIRARMCPNGHPAGPVQEASRGAQAV